MEVFLEIRKEIRQQWKTIRKAFHDLKKDKDSGIEPKELKFYLNHWGFKLSDDNFKELFRKFDLDGDGKIGYKEF